MARWWWRRRRRRPPPAARRGSSSRRRSPASARPRHSWLPRVMEDDAEGVALAARQGAETMAHLDAEPAARAGHRALVVGERDALAGGGGDGGGARLAARALLGEDQLAALVVAPGDRQRN